MNNYISFLADQSELIHRHINDVSAFLVQQQDVSKEYLQQKATHTAMPFNVFTIVSDLYYRENFHSDMLCSFLDVSGKHGDGGTYLNAFIDMLNKHCHRHISKLDYVDAESLREYSRIDILVRSKMTKHCIIIENKIYNATDMRRQLPRYYDEMTKEGYTIDAIVYLPLDKSKRPNRLGWSEDDNEHVNPLLCILPAYTKDGKVNLVDHWILPCALLTSNINCIAVLKQYAELVKHLNENIMNSVILKKFYESLLADKNNVDSANAICEMVRDLPVYMADRLVETFQNYNSLFHVWQWKPNFCGFIFHINGAEYRIDIWTSLKGYAVYVFEQTETNGMECLDGKTMLNEFTLGQNNRFYRLFDFYDVEPFKKWLEKSIDEVAGLCDKEY